MRSVREMFYEQAQAILDGTLNPEERAKFPDYDILERELRAFLDISRAFQVGLFWSAFWRMDAYGLSSFVVTKSSGWCLGIGQHGNAFSVG